MNPKAHLLAFLLPLVTTVLWATSLPINQPVHITATGECIDKEGMEMEEASDMQMRYACLESATVQKRCDFDGRLARLRAYQQWMAQLKEAQQQCDQKRGHFAFENSSFREPSDESFCSPAQVQVSYGQFENPICRFVSQCPTVAVRCTAAAPDAPPSWVPTQAIQTPGVAVPIRIH